MSANMLADLYMYVRVKRPADLYVYYNAVLQSVQHAQREGT